MSSAWLFQAHRDKQQQGDTAPWSVGWMHKGKRKSKKVGCKSLAEKYRKELQARLTLGVFHEESKTLWADFRRELEEYVKGRLRERSLEEFQNALNKFEEIVNPYRVDSITGADIRKFVTGRKRQRGRKPGSTVSEYTVKKELTSIKRALNLAFKWKYLRERPDIEPMKMPEAMPRPVTREHFDAIYQACESAAMPQGLPCEASDWWRAILMFAITTGWRKEEILLFQREDLEMETGRVVTRAGNNKGGRDDVDFLPEATMEHLRLIQSFDPRVFPWPHHLRTFDVEFHRIQKAAGIKLPCIIDREHKCTESCYMYGMHDLRRAYATENCDRLPLPVLQKKMRHRDIQTTMRYVEMASKMRRATDEIYVPTIKPKAVNA